MLGPNPFTDDEVQQFRNRLQDLGLQWSLLSKQMGKSIAVLKLFYSVNKKKFGFDTAVNEYYKLHTNEDRRKASTDGDESDVSVTSSDDGEQSNKKMFGGGSSNNNNSNLEKQQLQQSIAVSSANTSQASTITKPSPSVVMTGSNITPAPSTSDLVDTTNSKTISNTNNFNSNINNNSSSNGNSSSNLNNLNSKTGNVQVSKNSSNPISTSNSDSNKGVCLMMKSDSNQMAPSGKDLRLPIQSPFIISGGVMAVPINSQQQQQQQMQHQPPLIRNKKQSEDYDSSATETADEENESSPANRQSPKVPSAYSKLPPQSSISMVPGQINGPRSTSVHDVIVSMIERSVKQSPMAPVPLMNKNQQGNNSQENNDIKFVREYRNDMPLNKNQLRPPPSESLAILSVVNQNAPQQSPHMISQHPIGIPPQIAATITPVPPQQQISRSQDNSRQQMMGRNAHIQINESDQAFDLSIKKPQQQDRSSFPPPSHTKSIPPPPPSNSAIYRGDPSITNQSQNSQGVYLPFPGNDWIRPQPPKSPQTFISQGPGRVIQQQQQTPPPQMSQNKTKVTPKLSPKNQQSSVNQMNGPKGGSITHGTPLNASGQPIMINSSTTLSPRYEVYKQPAPSSGNEKIGSITQGTPVMSAHHMPDKRSYEYYKNQRQSPAQQGQGGQSQPPSSSASPHSVQQFGVPFARQPVNTTLYTLDHPQQPQFSKQLLANDYITSQQMHGQSRGMGNSINLANISNSRGDKEAHSPRSMTVSTSPAQIYYAPDKDRERVATGQTRAEYMSRSSPADHINR